MNMNIINNLSHKKIDINRFEYRKLALQFLFMWDIKQYKAEQLHNEFLKFINLYFTKLNYKFSNIKDNFSTQLIMGTIDNLNVIDPIIKKYSKNWAFNRISQIDLVILRISIYEILYIEDIHPIITINEAIKLAKIFSTEQSKNFINGILDNIKNNYNI